MRLLMLFPALLGVFAVLQAVLNRRIAQSWGLPATAVLNSAVLAALAGLVLILSRRLPGLLPADMAVSVQTLRFSAWYLLPGFFGLCLVAGLPYAMGKLGAAPTFITLIGAQILTSLLWDSFVEGKGLPLPRILGAVLVLAGAVLTAQGE